MSFAKSKIVNWDIVRTSKIMSHTFWISDTCMANARNYLCQCWQRSPNYAQWKSCSVWSNFVFFIFAINSFFILIRIVIPGSLCRKFIFLFLVNMFILSSWWPAFVLIWFDVKAFASFLVLHIIRWVWVAILIFHGLCPNYLHRLLSRCWGPADFLHYVHIFYKLNIFIIFSYFITIF